MKGRCSWAVARLVPAEGAVVGCQGRGAGPDGAGGGAAGAEGVGATGRRSRGTRGTVEGDRAETCDSLVAANSHDPVEWLDCGTPGHGARDLRDVGGVSGVGSQAGQAVSSAGTECPDRARSGLTGQGHGGGVFNYRTDPLCLSIESGGCCHAGYGRGALAGTSVALVTGSRWVRVCGAGASRASG